jgi:hypothetical protein
MVYVIALGLLALVVFGIMKAAIGRDYSKMTEEEFEAEVKRGSTMGAAVGGLQKIIDRGHTTEYIVEQQQRIEADRTNSGGRPESGSPEQPKARREP